MTLLDIYDDYCKTLIKMFLMIYVNFVIWFIIYTFHNWTLSFLKIIISDIFIFLKNSCNFFTEIIIFYIKFTFFIDIKVSLSKNYYFMLFSNFYKTLSTSFN